MDKLYTGLHLYQPPKYKANGDAKWRNTFKEAVVDLSGPANWDVAAILGILSFGYPCGDRTLIQGVTRQPWLSKTLDNQNVLLEEIPEHGRLWTDTEQIASRLHELLEEEVIAAALGQSFQKRKIGLQAGLCNLGT